MAFHNHVDHDNKAMLAVSAGVGFFSYLTAPEFSGERVHIGFAVVTCLVVFLFQKLLHVVWDNFVMPYTRDLKEKIRTKVSAYYNKIKKK